MDFLRVLEVGRRVCADDRGDLRQGGQRPDEDPVEHRPGDEERGDVDEARIVVAGVAVPGRQIDEHADCDGQALVISRIRLSRAGEAERPPVE